jgi:hypothetical protein
MCNLLNPFCLLILIPLVILIGYMIYVLIYYWLEDNVVLYPCPNCGDPTRKGKNDWTHCYWCNTDFETDKLFRVDPPELKD